MTMRAIVLVVAACAIVSGQSPRSRTLIVSVVDAGGVVAAGLTQADFTVDLSGVRVPVVDVTQRGEPLSIMLLFDRSASALTVRFDPNSPFASRIQGALLESETVSQVFSRNRQTSDREYFGRFSGYTEFRGPIAPDVAAWQSVLSWGLARVPSMSSSPIWDAVAEATRRIERDPGTRVVVLVTDGRSNANVLSLEDAAMQGVRSGVAVSVIDIGYPEQVRQEDKLVAVPRPDRLLMWLAEATGGHYVSDATVLRTRTISAGLLGNIVDRHRHAYRLRVNAPDGIPSPQSVKVTVNRPGATARTAAFIEVQ